MPITTQQVRKSLDVESATALLASMESVAAQLYEFYQLVQQRRG